MNTMSITLNIEAPILAEAINNLATAIRGGSNTITPVNDVQEMPIHEPQHLAEEQAKVIEDIRQELKEPEKQEHVAMQQKEETSEYTIEQIREAFGALSKAKGREVAKGILTDLGVKSVSSLQPGQFAQAMQMIEEA